MFYGQNQNIKLDLILINSYSLFLQDLFTTFIQSISHKRATINLLNNCDCENGTMLCLSFSFYMFVIYSCMLIKTKHNQYGIITYGGSWQHLLVHLTQRHYVDLIDCNDEISAKQVKLKTAAKVALCYCIISRYNLPD